MILIFANTTTIYCSSSEDWVQSVLNYQINDNIQKNKPYSPSFNIKMRVVPVMFRKTLISNRTVRVQKQKASKLIRMFKLIWIMPPTASPPFQK